MLCPSAQKPFGNFIRAVLLMPLYVPLFSPKASSSDTANTIYTYVLKVGSPTITHGMHDMTTTVLLYVIETLWTWHMSRGDRARKYVILHPQHSRCQ
jgi:hypothetical protein